MSASSLCYDDTYFCRENVPKDVKTKKVVSSRQSLKAKFDKEYKLKKNSSRECTSRPNCTSWCDALSISVANVNARQAWKNGTEKISQTFNNVRNTFGTLSQRIIKPNKRRQPLINIDSPQTPATPHARSRALLGRTPIKLYSPFHIDTPQQKENYIPGGLTYSGRSSNKPSFTSVNRKLNTIPKDLFIETNPTTSSETVLANDLLQAQLGVYEFHCVASSFVQKEKKKH